MIDLNLPLEAMFVQFPHLYDFKSRHLSDSIEIGFRMEQASKSAMKSSEDYLSYCINNGIKEAAKMFK